jgi:hypothetical protein
MDWSKMTTTLHGGGGGGGRTLYSSSCGIWQLPRQDTCVTLSTAWFNFGTLFLALGLVAYYLNTHTHTMRTYAYTLDQYQCTTLIRAYIYVVLSFVFRSVGRSIMCTSMMYPMQALLGWRSIVCIVGHVCVAAPSLDIALAQPKFLHWRQYVWRVRVRDENKIVGSVLLAVWSPTYIALELSI